MTIGSIVGTRVDLAEVFELHAAGKTKVILETRRLEDVNAAIDDVLAGQVDARVVFLIAYTGSEPQAREARELTPV